MAPLGGVDMEVVLDWVFNNSAEVIALIIVLLIPSPMQGTWKMILVLLGKVIEKILEKESEKK